MQLLIFAVLFASCVVVIQAKCPDGLYQTVIQCSSVRPCPYGHKCYGGVCCSSAPDCCPNGYDFTQYTCQGRRKCPSNTRCFNGRCCKSCHTSYCPVGRYWSGNTCGVGVPCRPSTDLCYGGKCCRMAARTCPSGYGYTPYLCTNDRKCPPRTTCLSGRCCRLKSCTYKGKSYLHGAAIFFKCYRCYCYNGHWKCVKSVKVCNPCRYGRPRGICGGNSRPPRPPCPTGWTCNHEGNHPFIQDQTGVCCQDCPVVNQVRCLSKANPSQYICTPCVRTPTGSTPMSVAKCLRYTDTRCGCPVVGTGRCVTNACVPFATVCA